MKDELLLGSQLWLHKHDSDETLAAQIDAMLDAGLTLTRIFIPWSDVETGRDERDWDLYDRLFRVCEPRGMLLTVTLSCLGAPRWFERSLKGRVPTRADEDALGALRAGHVRETARRYAPSAALHSWILANEPRITIPVTEASLTRFREYLTNVHKHNPGLFSRLYKCGGPDEVGEILPDGKAKLDFGRWDFAAKVDWAGFETARLNGLLADISSALREIDKKHPTTVNPDNITQASPYMEGRDLWAFGGGTDFLGLSCHVSWHSTRFSSEKIHQSVGMFCDMTRSATGRGGANARAAGDLAPSCRDEYFHVTELQAGTNYFSGLARCARPLPI